MSVSLEEKIKIVKEILSEKQRQYEKANGPVEKKDFDLDLFVGSLPYEGTIDIVQAVQDLDFAGLFKPDKELVDRGFCVNRQKIKDSSDMNRKTVQILWFDEKFDYLSLNEVLLSDAENLIKETMPFDMRVPEIIDEKFALEVGKLLLRSLAQRNTKVKICFS